MKKRIKQLRKLKNEINIINDFLQLKGYNCEIDTKIIDNIILILKEEVEQNENNDK